MSARVLILVERFNGTKRLATYVDAVALAPVGVPLCHGLAATIVGTLDRIRSSGRPDRT